MSKKFNCVISPGHTAKTQGASRGIVREYGLSAAIIGDLTYRADKAGHTCHLIGSASNKKQIERINCLRPDFGFELHFNANVNPNVNGTMCLYSGSTNGKNLASEISSKISISLKTRDRGPVIGNYQLDRRKKIIDMIRLTSCPFCVVEPLYLSNDQDFEKIDIQLISIAIFNAMVSYWEKLNH